MALDELQEVDVYLGKNLRPNAFDPRIRREISGRNFHAAEG